MTTDFHSIADAPPGALRSILMAAATARRLPMADLTVLSACRDPYRLDTPAGHAKGKWLADAYALVNPESRRLHLRGLHYLLVGRVNLPDGSPYVNDNATWTWMSEQAAKAARWLGYLPWRALRDARNAPPLVFRPTFERPYWGLCTAEVDVRLPADLEPRLEIQGDICRQPWQQIVIAEKQGVADLLRPIVERYQGTLATPTGELSDALLWEMLADAINQDGRPVAIHQLGDFDPAGYQMAVSTARTAQALRDSQFPDLEIRVHAVGLTLEQCIAWNLPSTPLKETEARADRWQAAMGRAQTELDAAVALAPDAFAQVVRDSLDQYYDRGLADRANDLRAALELEANARLAEQLDVETLELVRASAEARLAEISSAVDAVNAALRFDIDACGIEVPALPIMIGEAVPTDCPLFDSADDWAEATRRLIDRKAYRECAQ